MRVNIPTHKDKDNNAAQLEHKGMLMLNFRCRKGFTLVEMSVVLVILGIILTTVIKGGEVLRSSRIKGLIQTQNDLQVATMAYRERYGNKSITLASLQSADFMTGANGLLVDRNFGVNIAFGNYTFVSSGGKVSIQAVKYFDLPFDVAQAMETALDGAGGAYNTGSVQGSSKELNASGLPITNNYMIGPSSTLYTIICALYPVAP